MPLDFAEYQRRARATSAVNVGPVAFAQKSYASLGLSAEAGAVANQVKKVLRDDNTTSTPEREKEIMHYVGGSLWYIAEICTVFGVSMEEVAKANIEMLEDRQRRGVIKGDGHDR